MSQIDQAFWLQWAGGTRLEILRGAPGGSDRNIIEPGATYGLCDESLSFQTWPNAQNFQDY
jgi:hypothetical protein